MSLKDVAEKNDDVWVELIFEGDVGDSVCNWELSDFITTESDALGTEQQLVPSVVIDSTRSGGVKGDEFCKELVTVEQFWMDWFEFNFSHIFSGWLPCDVESHFGKFLKTSYLSYSFGDDIFSSRANGGDTHKFSVLVFLSHWFIVAIGKLFSACFADSLGQWIHNTGDLLILVAMKSITILQTNFLSTITTLLLNMIV